MDADRDTCLSCIGTGIGNPNVDRSVCSACNGRGIIQRPQTPVDEDRWAWNHFDPEPGDEDEQYRSWGQVSAGAADSHAALQQQPEPEAPIGWLYDWTHSSALGKPDEQFTGFTTDEAYARKHDNPRAVYTAPPALQEVPRELVARIDRETVIRLAREAVSNGDGSELSGDAIERFAQLVFLEAASPSTTRQQEAGSESTRAVQLTVEEIAFVMNELTPEHDGSDFEADCPCCTAYAKLKAAVDWDAEHGIAAAPSTPEKADGVTVPVSQPKAPPGTDGGPHG